MYKISDDERIVKAYYDKIYSYSREFQLEVFLNNSQIPSNDIMALTIDTDGLNDGLTVGKIITTSVSLTVVPNHTITVKDTISINIGLKIKNPYNGGDMILNFPFGVYEINSVEVKDYNLEITCYSKGFNQLQEQFYPLGTQYTSTSLLNEISSKTGFQFEGYSDVPLMNEDIVVEGNEGQKETKSGSNFEGLTYNDIISNVASSLVSNVIFSRDGKLKFVPLSHSIQSIESLQDYTKPTTMGNTTYKKRRVEVFKREDTGTLYAGEIENITALEVLQVNNPLASQSQVNQLYNTLKGVEYAHLDGVDVYLYPIHLDVLDAVTVDLNGKQHLMPICKQSIKYSNGVFATVSSYAQQSTDSYTGSLTSKVDNLGKVTSTILHEQDRIELSVSHVKENYSTKEETNSKIEVAVGEITLEINKVNNTTEELKTLISLTEDEIRQEVVNVKDGLETNISTIAGQLKIDMDNKNAELKGTIEATYSRLSVLYNDNLNNLQSQIIATKNEITASVNDKTNNLQSQITATSNSISTKVSKGDIVSSINQSAENVRIKASKIDLNGTVTVTGNNRHIKIEDANYSVFDGNIRKAYLGFRGVSGTDYVVPKFVLSATNTEGVAHEYFVVTPYKGNKENPQSTDYGYVDIAYHTNWYSASTGGDWSNVKLYANGDMRVSPIRKLEITTNFNKGEYGGGYERLVAEFRSDNHTWYNGNLSVGAVVNRTNGNGLILIDQHDHLGRQAGVRVQCNDDGGHTFRPLTNGECYNGTSNYRWKQIYAVKSTIATSDKRHKIIFGNMNSIDCYEMIKNIPLYNYYMLGENKENLTKEEIEERMTEENKQMGLMAQDLIPYECGEYILDYQDDTYGINEYQLIQATIGALQEEIHLRDAQIEELKQDIEYLKGVINND